MTDPPRLARRLWQLLEPVHAVVYFAPEPIAALAQAGYRGFWMGYFAGRAAPLGAADAEPVHAIFYNFAYSRVAKALPAAWDFAPPEAALTARSTGAVAALRRHLGVEQAHVERAARLAERAARHAPLDGRALFAANSRLAWPDEPLARLWHAATLLREHRGDGHNATLLSAGIGGREAHVFHALANRTPREVYTSARDFSDDEWAEHLVALQERGLASDHGLTEAGARLKAQIEQRTDALAAPAYARLSDAECSELVEVLLPITRAVVAAGDIPLDAPMGLNLRTVG